VLSAPSPNRIVHTHFLSLEQHIEEVEGGVCCAGVRIEERDFDEAKQEPGEKHNPTYLEKPHIFHSFLLILKLYHIF
jgi:hypothetical protein